MGFIERKSRETINTKQDLVRKKKTYIYWLEFPTHQCLGKKKTGTQSSIESEKKLRIMHFLLIPLVAAMLPQIMAYTIPSDTPQDVTDLGDTTDQQIPDNVGSTDEILADLPNTDDVNRKVDEAGQFIKNRLPHPEPLSPYQQLQLDITNYLDPNGACKKYADQVHVTCEGPEVVNPAPGTHNPPGFVDYVVNCAGGRLGFFFF